MYRKLGQLPKDLELITHTTDNYVHKDYLGIIQDASVHQDQQILRFTMISVKY